jgi:hypothetical protein
MVVLAARAHDLPESTLDDAPTGQFARLEIEGHRFTSGFLTANRRAVKRSRNK